MLEFLSQKITEHYVSSINGRQYYNLEIHNTGL